jgi:hypothetical protein
MVATGTPIAAWGRIDVDGNTWREPIRALKRRLVRPVYRLLLEGSNLQLAAA